MRDVDDHAEAVHLLDCDAAERRETSPARSDGRALHPARVGQSVVARVGEGDLDIRGKVSELASGDVGGATHVASTESEEGAQSGETATELVSSAKRAR